MLSLYTARGRFCFENSCISRALRSKSCRQPARPFSRQKSPPARLPAEKPSQFRRVRRRAKLRSTTRIRERQAAESRRRRSASARLFLPKSSAKQGRQRALRAADSDFYKETAPFAK